LPQLGDSLPKSGFFLSFGAAFPTTGTDWREILLGQICNESPLWDENADFLPESKFNTGSLPLHGILLVTRTDSKNLDTAPDNVIPRYSCSLDPSPCLFFSGV